MTNIELSEKMRDISLCGAVLIVLHHMNSDYIATLTPFNAGVHDFVCNQLSFWAVRFFFVMSGFWFVRGHYAQDGKYLAFLRGKVWTLFVPYVIFAFLGMFVFAVCSPAYHLLNGKPLLQGTVFLSSNLSEAINSTFGILGHPQWNGSLWYVRALLLIFVFAPILRFVSRHCVWVLLIAWVVLANFRIEFLYSAGLDIRPNQSCYFFLGMFVGKCGLETFKLRSSLGWLLLGVWIVMGLAFSVCVTYGVKITGWRALVQNVRFMLSIPMAWTAYDLLHVRDIPIPRFVRGPSFFIFCSHGMVGLLLASPLRCLLGRSTCALLLLTFVSWVVTVCGCVVLAKILDRYFPRAYLLLIGNRKR